MPMFTVPDYSGGGGGPPGSGVSWSHTWGFNGRVPGGSGLRALRPTQGRTAFQVGLLLPVGSTLEYMTISVNAPDGARDFVLEFLSDPTGAATVIASLPLPSGVRQVPLAGLSVAIPTDYGLQVRRTSGAGQSTFNSITASVGGSLS